MEIRSRLVDVIIGGQFGSEGKGHVAFQLAPKYDVLVRVGGPNAGHIVPTEPPYTHRQLPSGTLANPEAQLLIGPGATIDADLLLREIEECAVPRRRLTIDAKTMVISSDDILAERQLVASIASTGKGGGAAAARRILGRGGAVQPKVRLARDVPSLRSFVGDTATELDAAFAGGRRVLLEGTQGTMLSLFHGYYPWVTSRDTTAAGCLSEAGIAPTRVDRVIMVLRTYPIRVGNAPSSTSGPMGSEIDWRTVAARSGNLEDSLLRSERGSVSGTLRRVAEFDWAALRRASELNGATDIALTFADYLCVADSEATHFDQLSVPTRNFVTQVEQTAGVPVTFVSASATAGSLLRRTATGG